VAGTPRGGGLAGAMHRAAGPMTGGGSRARDHRPPHTWAQAGEALGRRV